MTTSFCPVHMLNNLHTKKCIVPDRYGEMTLLSLVCYSTADSSESTSYDWTDNTF